MAKLTSACPSGKDMYWPRFLVEAVSGPVKSVLETACAKQEDFDSLLETLKKKTLGDKWKSKALHELQQLKQTGDIVVFQDKMDLFQKGLTLEPNDKLLKSVIRQGLCPEAWYFVDKEFPEFEHDDTKIDRAFDVVGSKESSM